MGTSGFSHSADYRYIDEALKSRWKSFCALTKEMEEFQPQPLSSFAEYREKEYNRLRPINPDKTDESLFEFIDKQISCFVLPNIQFITRFDDQFMAEYVTITILSHALVEAIINAIISIGLTYNNSVELVHLLEKSDLKQKWQFGPKSFASDWIFPRNSGLFETLTKLIRQRNAIIHYKIKVEKDGNTLLDGSRFDRKRYSEDTIWLLRFFSLPYDLEEYARQKINNPPIMLFLDRRSIAPAKAHRNL
jgi:hypothetical protein